MNRNVTVGFSQRIQLEWLERTALLYLAGYGRQEIVNGLQELLRERLSIGGTAERGNREKAISILMKVWVTVPAQLQGLRDDGLRFLRELPPEDHLALHWGMTMAVYPFVAIVAEAAGRLHKLQGKVAAAQVQRRVREQLGERETVARAARRVLRCFIDWQVLGETPEKGLYEAVPIRPVRDEGLAAWLVEATLRAGGSGMLPLRQVLASPALFPFSLGNPSPRSLESSGRLALYKQGLDEDMVMLV